MGGREGRHIFSQCFRTLKPSRQTAGGAVGTLSLIKILIDIDLPLRNPLGGGDSIKDAFRMDNKVLGAIHRNLGASHMELIMYLQWPLLPTIVSWHVLHKSCTEILLHGERIQITIRAEIAEVFLARAKEMVFF